MTGWWLTSYVALWILVLLLAALLLGTIRELGIVRGAAKAPDPGQIAGYRGPEDNGPPLDSPLPHRVFEGANSYGPLDLGSFAGEERNVLMFMTPTCMGCQLAVEALNALVSDGGIPGVRAAVILSGEEVPARSFLNVFPLHMPVIFDTDRSVSREFGVHVAPTGLVYNREGRLVSKGTPSCWDELVALLALDAGAPPTLAASAP